MNVLLTESHDDLRKPYDGDFDHEEEDEHSNASTLVAQADAFTGGGKRVRASSPLAAQSTLVTSNTETDSFSTSETSLRRSDSSSGRLSQSFDITGHETEGVDTDDESDQESTNVEVAAAGLGLKSQSSWPVAQPMALYRTHSSSPKPVGSKRRPRRFTREWVHAESQPSVLRQEPVIAPRKRKQPSDNVTSKLPEELVGSIHKVANRLSKMRRASSDDMHLLIPPTVELAAATGGMEISSVTHSGLTICI